VLKATVAKAAAADAEPNATAAMANATPLEALKIAENLPEPGT
jgi:hypothetical protein